METRATACGASSRCHLYLGSVFPVSTIFAMPPSPPTLTVMLPPAGISSHAWSSGSFDALAAAPTPTCSHAA
jgi:hypothetical protein